MKRMVLTVTDRRGACDRCYYILSGKACPAYAPDAPGGAGLICCDYNDNLPRDKCYIWVEVDA